MNSKFKGLISEMQVTAALVKTGRNVLFPMGDCQRYDFVLEFDEKFYKVQCKTAAYKGDKIVINASSTTTKNGSPVKHGYEGDVDFVAAYCFENNQCYLVPIKMFQMVRELTLRFEKPLNKQVKKVHFASEFLIGG